MDEEKDVGLDARILWRMEFGIEGGVG